LSLKHGLVEMSLFFRCAVFVSLNTHPRRLSWEG
jgi:hypothetical protein